MTMPDPMPLHRFSRRRRLALPLVVAGVTALGGCVSDGPRPPPPPQPVPPQPSGIEPDRIVRAVGLPEDSDRNGLSDIIPLTVYLFATGYDAPLQVDGRFVFELRTADGRSLARWEYDEARTRAAARRFLVGPGYIFRLSLLDAGAERLPAREPMLFVSFYPSSGPPIEPRGGTTIYMGVSH